jgi:hypothetical protein
MWFRARIVSRPIGTKALACARAASKMEIMP